MSRITKEIAYQVAKKLTEEKQKEIDLLNKSMGELVYSVVLKTIPEEVITCYNKHKTYFDTNSSVRFNGNGFNFQYFNMPKSLPLPDRMISPNDEDSKGILAQFNNIQNKDKELKLLRKEIEVALFNLRTYNQVEKEFPEAFPHLPKPPNTALIVNIKSIREKL